MSISQKDKMKKAVFNELKKANKKFPPDVLTEVPEENLLGSIRLEYPVIDTNLLRNLMRELEDEGGIKFDPSDAGFPNDKANRHYRFKILQKDEMGKQKIFISLEDGIYKDINNKKEVYGMRGKRFRLIQKLRGGRKDGNILAQSLEYSSLTQLSKEVACINEIFKKNLNLEYKLIIHPPMGGYKLNVDKYDIEFIT